NLSRALSLAGVVNCLRSILLLAATNKPSVSESLSCGSGNSSIVFESDKDTKSSPFSAFNEDVVTKSEVPMVSAVGMVECCDDGSLRLINEPFSQPTKPTTNNINTPDANKYGQACKRLIGPSATCGDNDSIASCKDCID